MEDDVEVGLRRLVRVSLLGIVLSVAGAVGFHYAMRDDLGFSQREGWFRAMSAVGLARLGVEALALAAAVRLRRLGPAAWVALACLAVDLAVDVVSNGWAFAGMDGGHPAPEWWYRGVVRADVAVVVVGNAALAWALGTAAREAGAPALVPVVRGVGALFVLPQLLYLAAGLEWIAWGEWMQSLGLVGEAALGAAAFAVRRRVPTPDGAAAGLRTYRGAVVARVVIAVAGVIAVLIAARGLERPKLAAFLIVAAPALGLVPGWAMGEGMARYARSTGDLAWHAFALFVAATAIDVAGLVGFGALLFGGDDEGWLAEHARALGIAGPALGLLTLLLLLGSFTSQARALEADDLVPRIQGQIGLTLAAAVAAVLLAGLVAFGPLPGPAVALFGLAALVVGVILLVRFLAILDDLALRFDQRR